MFCKLHFAISMRGTSIPFEHIVLCPRAYPDGQLRLVWVKAVPCLQWKLARVFPPSLGVAHLRALPVVWHSTSSSTMVSLSLVSVVLGQPRSRGKCSSWRTMGRSQEASHYVFTSASLSLTVSHLVSIFSSHVITRGVSTVRYFERPHS